MEGWDRGKLGIIATRNDSIFTLHAIHPEQREGAAGHSMTSFETSSHEQLFQVRTASPNMEIAQRLCPYVWPNYYLISRIRILQWNESQPMTAVSTTIK
jgi:hypothetical protein